MNEISTCAALDGVAEELALGTMSGPQRAQAIAHLDTCARCRGVVDGLTATGDSLLLLAPEEPPPFGFETRVANAMRPAAIGPQPVPNRWRRLAVAGTVAAALVLGVVAGRLLTPAGGSSGVKVALATAEGGKAVCRAVVIPGSPVHLVVTIDEPRAAEADAADYVVETASGNPGATETAGTLRLVDGHGVLSTSIAGNTDGIESVRVFQSGQLRYEARF